MSKFLTTKTPMAILIAISAFFITSCKDGPKRGKARPVFTIQNPSFSCKVQESGLHLNADNEIQCEHYFHYETDPKTGYKIQAGQMKNLVSILLNVDEMNAAILIETDTIKNKFFNIDYKGEITEENNQKILKKLLDFYNLKLIKDSTKVNTSELFLKNNKKLKPYISKTQSGSTSIELQQNNILRLKNASLKILASQLKQMYGKRFSYNKNDTTKYNLKIKLKDSWDETAVSLKENYGIAFKNIQQDITKYSIVDKPQE